MSSKGSKKIISQDPSEFLHRIRRAEQESYTDLLKFCIQIDPEKTESCFLSDGAEFANCSDAVFREIEKFKLRVSSIPLLSVILLWARNVSKDKVFGARHISLMFGLLENKLIPHHHGAKDALETTIFDYAGLGHQITLDRIRSYKEWSIDKREDYVKFYVEFANWLSDASFGFIPKAIDFDRTITANRWLPFDIYISIVKELADRERILAKIFYLGGARSLEEVLSLKIEDIDFRENVLKISENTVSYPKHVFEDLKEYMGGRKRGYVFVNRQGDRIDHTVPYRALKTVIEKLKLDPSFTFKDFVKNV